MVKCRFCDKPAYPKYGNGLLCYYHFFIDLFQHNESEGKLGVISFAFTVFPQRFTREWGVAQMHREMLWSFLYDEPGWQREDRALTIATFRSGAKTAWFSFLLPLYFIAMADEGIFIKDFKLPRSEEQTSELQSTSRIP